ncbi:DUF6895 family protein [Actinokineospora inagensis]|uniref:DUF6895 family protein n=1 Tax=Actinokineospora inagensis TaxID=103730 RepID=UPI000686BC57|nr:hypothetical protein [Actinokineospora inagensis]
MRQIAWLTENSDWFKPAVWNEMLPARQFAAGPLLELLVLCDAATCGPLTDRALEIAEEVTATKRFRAGLYRGDALFTHHVWLLALMNRLGSPSPLLPAAQLLLHTGVRPAMDGVAALELRFAARLGGLECPHLPPSAQLYRRWRDGQHLDPFRLTGSESYALTHAVFYATSFGRVPLPEDAELNRTTRLLLATHLAVGDYDLGAELLHTALLTGGPTGLVDAHRHLEHAVQPDGYVPGPLHDTTVLAQLSGRKARAYRFGTGYHTTLVTALASSAWQSHPTAPLTPEITGPADACVDLVLAVRGQNLRRTADLLLASTRSNPTVQAAAAFLRSQRQPEGGFGIPPDPNLTAKCEAALAAVESPSPGERPGSLA